METTNMLGRSESAWGCCGGRVGGADGIPLGIDGFTSRAPIEDSDRVPVVGHPRWSQSTKAIDIGLGNYLNIKLLHILDMAEKDVAAKNYAMNKPVAFPPLEDGPPCYAAYFGAARAEFHTGWRLERGSWADDNYVKSTPEERQTFSDIASKITGFTATYVLREYPNNKDLDQVKLFREWIKNFGWDQHIVYESPLFNNRMHNNTTDYLRFVVIQKD